MRERKVNRGEEHPREDCLYMPCENSSCNFKLCSVISILMLFLNNIHVDIAVKITLQLDLFLQCVLQKIVRLKLCSMNYYRNNINFYYNIVPTYVGMSCEWSLSCFLITDRIMYK